MKKTILIYVLLLLGAFSFGSAQTAKWVTHSRGLLHQSVFNTGAMGVHYNYYRSVYSGDSSMVPMEWPGNSYFRMDNHDFWYYNENGAGLVLCCDTGKTTNRNRGKFLFIDSVGSTTTKGVDMVGCLGAGGGGTYRDGNNLHWFNGDAQRFTNFPLNSDGTWNPTYDPTEAEEKTVTSVYTPYGLKITRTGRAWSIPGYDSFIIYDYEIKNTGEHFKWNTNAPTYILPTHKADTLSDIAVDWLYSLFPSYVYANQVVGDFTTEASKALSRIDLTRYLEYVVSPDGRPFQKDFATFAKNGTYGGGLSAPASVGYMCLYYDYDKLQKSTYSRFTETISSTTKDSLVVFDPNLKFKQPWVWASTQANLTSTKILSHVEAAGSRYAVWNPNNATDANDAFLTTHMGASRAAYWYGRARPNANFNFASPMVHSMTYGPYQLAPDSAFHVVIAEVAGFGSGRKADAQFWDCGGGTETVVTSDFMHPVSSWDTVLVYATANPASASSTGGAGIAYIPQYGIPSYIRDTTVVSMRDVADRCIQLYSGNPKVVKWDTSQYEPSGGWAQFGTPAPSPAAVSARSKGWSAAIKLPLPGPILTGIVNNTTISKITWQNTVESIPSSYRPYFNSGLDHYEILRSTSQLGPWTKLDNVNRQDTRYWNQASSPNLYSFVDNTAQLGATYYYAVVSVDSLGKKSGLSNLLKQQANLPFFTTLGKVYAVPNPFFVVSGVPGENPGTTYIQFFGLTKNSTIRVFSFSGQLIKTLHSDGALQSIKWDMRSESQKKIASGVYYFTVQDDATGSKAWNKFVVIH